MAKRRSVDPATSLAAELRAEFNNWNKKYTEGGSDPSWPDGVNLNLIRNHIIYYKSECEEKLAPEQYPAEYFQPTPPEVDDNYMARADEIRENALLALQRYKEDQNFLYLLAHFDQVPDNRRFRGIVGYVRSLEIAIARDDLVTMRRHERPDLYADSFASGRKELEEALAKECAIQDNTYEQLSLFA